MNDGTLEAWAETAAKQLTAATRAAGAAQRTPAFRRMALDMLIQEAMGRFFSLKIRCGMLWAIFMRTGDAAASRAAVDAYRSARRAWAETAQNAKGAYAADITYGPYYFHRGHWLDRLEAIDQDIADMERRSAEKPSIGSGVPADKVTAAIRAVGVPTPRPDVTAEHRPPPRFDRGRTVELDLQLTKYDMPPVMQRLHYRRVNQAEAWQSQDMAGGNGQYRGTIPAAYTDSQFPLQYYFELSDASGQSRLLPGFNSQWSNQPYYVIRQART